MNKKKLMMFAGIGLFSVMLVSALIYVAMTMSFTKTIHIAGDGGTEEKMEIVSVTGTYNTAPLTYEGNGIYTSGNVILTNNDGYHDVKCTITTPSTVGDEVTSSYSSELIVDNIKVLESSEVFTFHVIYDANLDAIPGDYPITTTITCEEA